MVAMFVIVLTVVVLAALAGLAALVALVMSRAAAARDAERQAEFERALVGAVAQVAQQAASERDAAVQAALEHAAVLHREMVGAQAVAGQHDLAVKRDEIAAGLGEVRQELARMTSLVGQLGDKQSSVEGQLRAHAELTQHLATTTQGLREALANSKARGQWGERMAEDVLRHAGFVEHVNYRKQVAVEGGRSIPDFTFFLPKGQMLYMDVKFPLAAYLRYLEAPSEAERQAHLAAFLRDVRQRVRELAVREYGHAGPRAVEQVLLFLPNESVSGFIHEHDPGLLDEALAHQVVLCSPLNLFVLLGVVRQAHDNFAVERTADDMLAILGSFQAQWSKFTQALDAVEKRLESARRGFEELNGPRRRQLERPLGKLEELRRERRLPPDEALVADDADVLELRELA
jgi:DNA recombination protein RmuC